MECDEPPRNNSSIDPSCLYEIVIKLYKHELRHALTG